jgi:hypothetical protein
MRLEPGVDARLVDFDHEVAVVVVRQHRLQYGMGFAAMRRPVGLLVPVIVNT